MRRSALRNKKMNVANARTGMSKIISTTAGNVGENTCMLYSECLERELGADLVQTPEIVWACKAITQC